MLCRQPKSWRAAEIAETGLCTKTKLLVILVADAVVQGIHPYLRTALLNHGHIRGNATFNSLV